MFYHFNQAKPVPMTSDSADPIVTPIQKLSARYEQYTSASPKAAGVGFRKSRTIGHQSFGACNGFGMLPRPFFNKDPAGKTGHSIDLEPNIVC